MESAGYNTLDLVHSTAYMKPETYGIPLIVTVHDVTFITHPQFHTQENIRFCNTNIEKAIKSDCHFFADSESTKNDIMRIYGVESYRISVIYIPIDLEKFRQYSTCEHLHLKQKYDLPERFFLYVGSLEPRKNVQSVLKAIQNYTGSEPMVIIGASGWKNSGLKQLIDENHDKVRMMGYVTQEELPIFYSMALATIYPSLYEGFGLPVLESMACGTPVITSDNSSIPEIAGNAGVLLDNPTDPSTILEAMREIAEDNALRNRLSAEGLNQAKKFSPETCARRAVEVYTGILNVKN